MIPELGTGALLVALTLALYGAVLILAMIAFPRGIQGGLLSLRSAGRRGLRALRARPQVSGQT